MSSSPMGSRKFTKIRARKWRRNDSGDALENNGTDSDWSHDRREGQAPFSSAGPAPATATATATATAPAIAIRGSRAQPAASRPPASSTRAKNWAALRLNVRMASQMNGVALAEKQRLEAIQKANTLYTRRLDDHLRHTRTKLALSVSPNRRNSRSAKLRHVGRFTDSGVAVASSGHEQPANLALDLLPHQSAKQLLEGGAAAAAAKRAGSSAAVANGDSVGVVSESDDGRKVRRRPKNRSAEERNPNTKKSAAPRAKRSNKTPEKGSAAVQGKGQSDAVANAEQSSLQPTRQESVSKKTAAGKAKPRNHAIRREGKADVQAREEKEAKVHLASARDREFRERQRRAVEHKSRQMMANKRASFRVVKGADDERFRQAQRDDHLETPEFLTNLLGAPVHKQAEEQKQQTQLPNHARGSENVSGDQRQSELKEHAASLSTDAGIGTDAKPKQLTKKQVREAERKAKLEAKAKAKRDRQARTDAAAASAARAAAEKAKAAAKDRAEREAEQAEIDGVQWNDNWSDDGGFEVDERLLDLAGFESGAEEEHDDSDHDALLKDSRKDSLGAVARSTGVDGPTGNDSSSREGFTAADMRPRGRTSSEAFRRYEQPVRLPAISPAPSSSASALPNPSAKVSAGFRELLQSQLSARPVPPVPHRFSFSTVLTTGKPKPQRLHKAEANLRRLERENMEAVATVFREMVETKPKVVVSVSPTGQERAVGERIVSQLRKRLRQQRLNRPNPMYRTKQKLLPLVMQLGR
eukprot:INCI12542.1.p1 GENE.INCI12542.1~~INCI12542.1.p1  ORF type:complete len:756 (+),score=150.59 INCI12542.1:63-2330(+)